ncbi:TetR/AcrR family transcriptional regulator [Streptomyces sp. Y7]|uniref:TetR/AcrR family transcriptional regulator n=1 Tax=Streptomyces sp. Y7 TaxID=3342392 RepID=UPI003719AA57
MTGSPHVKAPPGTGTVYRATLEALAQYGPRRAGMTQIARLADTNRPFLYRNWASRDALIREATQLELRRLLFVAREVPDTVPPRCRQAHFVVRAARLLREHPVVGTTARTAPELVHTAVLSPVSDWHTTAWLWLREHVTGHIKTPAERDSATLAVLTTALPYALTPSTNPPDPEERAAVDARLSTAVHLCLAVGTPCAAPRPPGGHTA